MVETRTILLFVDKVQVKFNYLFNVFTISKGLFHKAIIQSYGTIYNNIYRLNTECKKTWNKNFR